MKLLYVFIGLNDFNPGMNSGRKNAGIPHTKQINNETFRRNLRGKFLPIRTTTSLRLLLSFV
jgi:hypothetical protein